MPQPAHRVFIEWRIKTGHREQKMGFLSRIAHGNRQNTSPFHMGVITTEPSWVRAVAAVLETCHSPHAKVSRQRAL